MDDDDSQSDSKKRTRSSSVPRATKKKALKEDFQSFLKLHKERKRAAATPLDDLPAEIRLNIYRFLLHAEHVKEPYVRNANSLRKFHPQREYRYKFQTPILATCRKYHDEALPVYHDNAFVHVCIDDPRLKGELQCNTPAMEVLSDKVLRLCHMRVQYSPPPSRTSYRKCRGLLITPDDLPLLVHTLNRNFNEHRDRSAIGSLDLYLLDPQRSPILPGPQDPPLAKRKLSERALLRPFWDLCLNKKATITGAKDKNYARELRSRMSKRPCPPERWLERARTKLTEGDQFFNSAQLHDAVSTYDASTFAYRTVKTTDTKTIVAYINLCQRVAHAHLRLENYSQALDYTDIAIRAMEDAQNDYKVQEETRTVDFFCQRELASCEAKIEIPVHMDAIGVRQYFEAQTPEDQRKRNAFLMWMNWLKAGDQVMQKALLRYLIFTADKGDDPLQVQLAEARAKGELKDLKQTI